MHFVVSITNSHRLIEDVRKSPCDSVLNTRFESWRLRVGWRDKNSISGADNHMILRRIHINLMKISAGAEKLIFVPGINYRSGINFST